MWKTWHQTDRERDPCLQSESWTERAEWGSPRSTSPGNARVGRLNFLGRSAHAWKRPRDPTDFRVFLYLLSQIGNPQTMRTGCSVRHPECWHWCGRRFPPQLTPGALLRLRPLSLLSRPPSPPTHPPLPLGNTDLLSISWRRQRHPTPVLLPGKSHGRRSLVGCSPWGC